MKFSRLFILMALSAVLAGCGGGLSDDDPVRVSVTAVPDPAAPGGSVTLLWRFELADGWHLYWTGRNDSGYPPQIELELPAGWIAGGLQWPVPERYLLDGDILDHVYHDELVLLQQVGIPADATPGAFHAAAQVSWLGCKEACVPGKAEVAFEVAVAAVAGPDDDPALAAALATLPEPLPAGTFATRWEGPVFHLAAAGARRLTFMPTGDCGDLADLVGDGVGSPLALEFRPKKGTVGPVRGLVTLEPEDGPARTFRIDFPATVPTAASTGG
jgi:DsbC/DsbD-like thiol-disulfide interchange protein